MKHVLYSILFCLLALLSKAQTDTSGSYFNKDFLNDNLNSGKSENYFDSLNVEDAKDEAWRFPVFRALSIGYSGKLLIPAASYNYGANLAYLNGFDISIDLSEASANLRHKDLNKVYHYSVNLGFSLHFGNFGKINNYYSTKSGDTSKTYTLSNSTDMIGVYLEVVKRARIFSPFISLAYGAYSQNLTNIIKEKKGSSSSSSPYPITDYSSSGWQGGIGVKYIKRFPTGNGVIISVQSTYYAGSPIKVADIDEVTFDNNHKPVYTLKEVRPNFFSIQIGASYNF